MVKPPGLAQGAAAARRRGAERCPGGAAAALRGGSRAAELRPGGWRSQMGEVPSGEHTKSNGKWLFIVDFPMKNGDFP